jgi:hypothetical protein
LILYRPNLGHVEARPAVALPYARRWRQDHPRLVAWHDHFAAQVPAFAQTKVSA